MAVVNVPEVQVTELVMFAVLESLYVPVAVNCCVEPAGIDGFAGVTAMDNSAGPGSTVRFVVPLIAPEVALIVVLPAATPLARPVELIVAAAVLLEVHVTEFVMF